MTIPYSFYQRSTRGCHPPHTNTAEIFFTLPTTTTTSDSTCTTNSNMIELAPCPQAGIICIKCSHPIRPSDKHSMARQIGVHESRSHPELTASNLPEREAYVLQYDNKMREMARLIKDIMVVDEELAKETFLGYVGEKAKYFFCNHKDCCKLVSSKDHQCRNHASQCTKMSEGVTSRLWTTNSPKVIPVAEFDFNNPVYFNNEFFKYFHDDTNITIKCSCGSITFIGTVCSICHIDINNEGANKLSLALQNLLVSQSDRYDTSTKSATIDDINHKLTPNIWLHHTGWVQALKGCVYSDTYEFVNAKPNKTEKRMIDGLMQSLYGVVTAVKKIEPTHQIMSDIQRRTKHHDINARFPFYAFKCDSTWERYLRTIAKMSLVVFRMMEMSCNDNSINDDTTSTTSISSNNSIPTLKFNTIQKACYLSIKACQLEDASAEQTQIYVDFLLSLVDVTIHNEMSNVAILKVFAMISIKNDGRLADAICTTPVIAAFITVYKLLFLAKCINCFDSNDNYDDIEAAGATNKSWVKQLQLYVEKHFFVNDYGTVHSPITVMIKIFHYGRKVARENTGIGTIRWENDTVFHRDLSISISNYRWCIQSAASQLQTLLMKLLRFNNQNQLPVFHFAKIIDDQTNHQPLYSFLSEEMNQHWLCLKQQMNALSNRLSKEIMHPDHSINAEFVWKYEKEIAEFLKLLLVLMHVTGGQPARGTEITNLTYENTDYMPRNITIYRGLVGFCTTYHKGMTHTGKLKRIFRFLPEPVGTVLVYYLWLILPFWQNLKGLVTGASTKSPHLWAKQVVLSEVDQVKKEVWGTEVLSQGLASLFGNPKMTVRAYRHVIVAIARRFLSEKWSTDVVDEEALEEFGDGSNDVAMCNHILDLQAGHTTDTAVRVYARGTSENRTTYQGNMDEYYDATLKLHYFIFNRPNQITKSTTTTMEHLKEKMLRQKYFKLIQKDRLESLLMMDLDIELRRYMSKHSANTVVFRGNQRKTIEAVIERHPLILQIAPTGVGKTLSYALRAYMSHGGTTVVVVPLVALQDNLLIRFVESNISVQIWNSADFPTPCKILLVSPESVTSPAFLDCMNMLQDSSMFDLLVLEEVHLYLTSRDEYRPDMMNICNFIQLFGVPTLMMTATLSIKSQSHLMEKLGIDKVPITVLRDPTTRTNLRYEVRLVGNQSLFGPVSSVLNEPRFQNERIIIYVQKLTDGKLLSKGLQLPFYYAHEQEKKKMMQEWISSTMNRVIIATSAMGCGIDVPDVRLVLHAGSPKEISDFAQQSGRAGRDGNVSYSITLHRNFDRKYMSFDMDQYIGGNGKCRRIALDLAMDGVERGKCSANECPCDCCSKQLDTLSRSISPESVMAMSPFLPDDNHGSGNKSYDLDDCDGGDIDLSHCADDEVGIAVRDTSDIVDPGISMMNGSFVSRQYTGSGLNLLAPRAQLPVNIVTTGDLPSKASEIARKRQFIEQGLTQEHRKRCNFQEVQQQNRLDIQSLGCRLTSIPSFGKGCLICRVSNLTGPCTNWDEHNTKRTSIEKERQVAGDKVNPTCDSFAGLSIPPYCSCTMPGCYVPQMFCTSWEPNGNGGFRKVGDNCNHRDKLLDLVIALRDYNTDAHAYLMEKCDGDLTKLLTTRIVQGREKLLLLHVVFVEMYKKYLD